MFYVGETYKTIAGSDVEIIEEDGIGTSHRCIKGSDGLWRYNLEGRMGQIAGGEFGIRYPNDLVPEYGVSAFDVGGTVYARWSPDDRLDFK